MNKTVAYSGVIAIVLIGLAGVIVLLALKIDPTPLINLFSTTLPIAITAAVTFHQLASVKAQTAKIAKNVNGNTTKLLDLAKRNVMSAEEAEEIARIENENHDLIADGKHAA